MRNMTAAEAKRILGPHESTIRDAILGALSEYGSYPPEFRLHHSPRTTASNIHDLIVRNIRSAFDGVPGVALLENRGMFVLEIRGACVIRFKKLNRRLNASGIRTRQATAFLCQLEIEGMPPAARLQAGYRLNGLQAEVFITCPVAYGNLWVYPLDAEDASQIEMFPAADAAPSRRVVAKNLPDKKVGEDASQR